MGAVSRAAERRGLHPNPPPFAEVLTKEGTGRREAFRISKSEIRIVFVLPSPATEEGRGGAAVSVAVPDNGLWCREPQATRHCALRLVAGEKSDCGSVGTSQKQGTRQVPEIRASQVPFGENGVDLRRERAVGKHERDRLEHGRECFRANAFSRCCRQCFGHEEVRGEKARIHAQLISQLLRSRFTEKNREQERGVEVGDAHSRVSRKRCNAPGLRTIGRMRPKETSPCWRTPLRSRSAKRASISALRLGGTITAIGSPHSEIVISRPRFTSRRIVLSFAFASCNGYVFPIAEGSINYLTMRVKSECKKHFEFRNPNFELSSCCQFRQRRRVGVGAVSRAIGTNK